MPDAGIPVFPRDNEDDGEFPARRYQTGVELFRALGDDKRGDGVVDGIVVHPSNGVVNTDDYSEVESVSEGAGEEVCHVEAGWWHARMKGYLDSEYTDFGGARGGSGGDNGSAGESSGGPRACRSVWCPREIYNCYRKDKDDDDDRDGDNRTLNH